MRSYLVIVFLSVLSFNIKAQFTVYDTTVTHTDAAFFSAVFTDDSTGYVVGGWSGVAGVILKTTNAGASWNVKVVSSCLKTVFFSSKDTGYAAGENTAIMKTIDAGVTWTYLNTSVVPPSYLATSVCFINNDTGLVSLINGPGYAFLKTFDGGSTWINDVSDTLVVYDMFLVKPRTIFAMGDKISKTMNAGASWTTHPLLPISWGESMYFLNDSVGFATLERADGTPCFNYSTLVKTTDGGQTWNGTDYNCQGWLGTIDFPSNTTGYMLAPGRRLWKTTDGGVTWNFTTFTLDSAQTANNVSGIYLVCTDTNTCYIFTNDGTIIKTTNGGGNVGINEPQLHNESLTVYPNPAFNQITLEFETAETKKGSIEIKNVLGQTVKTITNGSFTKGINKIDIDLSEFSNGLYFVQLLFNDKQISTKFIKQ